MNIRTLSTESSATGRRDRLFGGGTWEDFGRGGSLVPVLGNQPENSSLDFTAHLLFVRNGTAIELGRPDETTPGRSQAGDPA